MYLVWIIACVPGLSLCLALLDIVRRSSTHAFPRITLCLAHAIPVCCLLTLPVFLTMLINKSLHMDPHNSHLVDHVTNLFL